MNSQDALMNSQDIKENAQPGENVLSIIHSCLYLVNELVKGQWECGSTMKYKINND